jgi:uncharacterized protein (UPF0332 family)
VTAPTPRDHLAQARANRSHAEWLLVTSPSNPTALEWAVTAAFYSALHGLTAFLLTQGVRNTSHVARARAIAAPTSGVPYAVHAAYRNLEVQSRAGRYDLQRFTWHDVRDLLDQELAVVAAFVGM